jgi:hypothetical protein
VLKKELEEAKAALAKANQRVAELEMSETGYLIVTPNPAYSSTTAGVRFLKGRAFVPDSASLQHFAVTPLKDTQLAKLSPAERKNYEERLKETDAQRCAVAMAKDFGYHVFRLTPETKEAVMKEADQIAQVGVAALEAEMKRARAEGLLTPEGYH